MVGKNRLPIKAFTFPPGGILVGFRSRIRRLHLAGPSELNDRDIMKIAICLVTLLRVGSSVVVHDEGGRPFWWTLVALCVNGLQVQFQRQHKFERTYHAPIVSTDRIWSVR
jgi:hypothetical protein